MDPETLMDYPLFWKRAAIYKYNAEHRAKSGDQQKKGNDWLQQLEDEHGPFE